MLDKGMKSILKFGQRYMDVTILIASRYQLSYDVKIPTRPKTSVTNRGPHSVSIWLVRCNSFLFFLLF